jgi:hypothetical protein
MATSPSSAVVKFSRWKKWKKPKVAFRGVWSVRNYPPKPVGIIWGLTLRQGRKINQPTDNFPSLTQQELPQDLRSGN